ncbi:hypothetical protein [Herbiconiux sp. YIM B11900]|uniref:hypothetical protein n=1 Tax=Herbiconiux sp. YIM B11900 TaxID=3404131 RepID=UPI003F872EDD
MRTDSQPSSPPAPTTLTKVIVGLVALLAVVMGLLSMHALDATVGHSGQPTVLIADVFVENLDHVDSIAPATTSSDVTMAAGGLIGCAAAGVLCALGVLALVKRAVRAREPSVGESSSAPSERPRLVVARAIPRATPSLFALTVLRT